MEAVKSGREGAVKKGGKKGADRGEPGGVPVTRRERARRSRLRILGAAREVFAANGYHGATMSEIAEASGLAVQTVSYFFGTKARLLSDLLGAAVMGELPDGEGGARPGDPAESDWFAAAMADDDGPRALGTFVGGAVDVFARAAAVAEVARVAALTDPEVEAVYRRAEDLRVAQFRRIVRALGEHGWLRADLTEDLATDVLVTVLSSPTYLALRIDRGWSPAQITAWFTEALTRLLLTDAPHRRIAARALG